MAILVVGDDIDIDDNVDELNTAEPDTPPYDAEIVAVPAETAAANPAVALKVTIPESKEVQVAQVVKVCEALFTNVPFAVNCCVVPGAMLGGFDGSIEIDATEEVVRVTSPLMLPELAVIVAVPADTAVASPFETPVLLTKAIASFDEVQVTEDVIFSLPPPE